MTSLIRPFVRYVHYIPIGRDSEYQTTVPYDNRLFYVYRGSADILADGKTYSLNQTDLMIIPSGTEYRLLTPEDSVTYIAVNFDYTQDNTDKINPIPPARAEQYDSVLRLEKLDFSDLDESFGRVATVRGMKDFSSKLVRLEREYSAKLLYYENITSDILSELLFLSARMLNSERNNLDSERAGEIIGYINENYTKSITNKDIGEKFGLHPNYISSLVKIHTGMPMHQYLMRVRVSHSVEFLTEKKYSIAQISEMCGFCDIYHFSKAFKKIMGLSPSKYI